MYTIVITKKIRKLALLIVSLAIVVSLTCKLYPKVNSWLFNVKDGVSVNGQDFSGLSRKEAIYKLNEIAVLVQRGPQDAFYYSESGEVIAENYGLVVDVDGTLNKLMSAKPKEEVNLVVSSIVPSVTKEMTKAIYLVDTKEKAIALCINVAWGEEYLPGILEELEKRHLHATFFITGTWAKQCPDLLKRIAEGGHELANHGYGHPHVINMNEAGLSDLILTNEKLIKEVTNQTTKLFAPPYGEVSERISAVVAKLGYKTIMWTIDTIDWQRPAPSVIVERVISKLQPGAIVLAHPTDPTEKALPDLLDKLESQGYRLMSVSDLISLGESGS